MVSPTLVLDLVESMIVVPRGQTVAVSLKGPDLERDRALVAAWCLRTGNQLVEVSEGVVTVRRGPQADPLAGLAPNQIPGTRLWMYTNFDCNLACDYCCVRSSPRAERRALGIDRVRRLAGEAVAAGVVELVLTGGEPFLLPDIDDLVEACTSALPTTLLTNGMLLHGRRLERLRRMDRERLALQISLDSPTPQLHDSHRGAGSWARAVEGIHTAQSEGFRVRIAATLDGPRSGELAQFRTFLEQLGIRSEDQVIRALAHRGVADKGLELTVDTLIPEVTVTADGIYWHPVSADDEDQLISRQIFPLKDAIDEVTARFSAYRTRADESAQWFSCA